MQKTLHSSLVLVCLSITGAKPPMPGPFKVHSGSYMLPGGWNCGGSWTNIWYPAKFQDGPFPITSFGHGMGGSMATHWIESVVSLGLVVVAPKNRNCNGHGADILLAISRSKQHKWAHHVLEHVDFSRTGIFGHSFGGVHVTGAAVAAQKNTDFGLRAVVMSGGTSPRKAAELKIPSMWMTAAGDYKGGRCYEAYNSCPSDYKVLASATGGGHMEPIAGGGRVNPFGAHFFGCHVADLQKSCNMIYGDGEGSMCHDSGIGDCKRKFQPFFTTTYTGTTTTGITISTTSITLPQDEFMLGKAGEKGCLAINGTKKVLMQNSMTGPCAKFVALGRQIKAMDMVDEHERCLTVHKKTKQWTLWKCSLNKYFQYFLNQGSKWCSYAGDYCVVVQADDPVTSTTSITTDIPTSSNSITTSKATGTTTPTTTRMAISSITTTTTTTTTANTITATRSTTTTTTTITTTSTATTIATTATTTTTTRSTTTTTMPITKTSITTTTTTTTSLITTTSSSTGQTLQSGDIIFLKSQSGDGNHIDVEDATVNARWQSKGTWQAITLEKIGGGAVFSGDAVYLKSHTGAHIDVFGEIVRARWHDRGTWQAMTIEKKEGTGSISSDDEVCLKAHTGRYLEAAMDAVRATSENCGQLEAMQIQSEAVNQLFSGDAIHLLAHTSNRIDVEGISVRARWAEAGLWQTFQIENYGGRGIYSGEVVFLRAYTGVLVHVQDEEVLAQWNDYGAWQRFVIEKGGGHGPVLPGDDIFLRAHTGKYLHVNGVEVRASWYEMGAWQTMRVERSVLRRLQGPLEHPREDVQSGLLLV